MNQLKDDQLQTELGLSAEARRELEAAGATHADLAELADQLLVIAGELRRNQLGADNTARFSSKPIKLPTAKERAEKAAQQFGKQQKNNSSTRHLIPAREAYAHRRARNAIFGKEELFGEPAWDILLDLYIAHLEGKPVSVSSACIGSAAPPTTGLRWLGVLADSELVLREHDPDDQRRVLVRLTDKGITAMSDYFSRLED